MTPPTAQATASTAPGRRAATLAVALLLALVGALLPAPAQAQSTWTPADQATIRPGAELLSQSGQCTANFVFTDGNDVLIGSAAHCTGIGGATDTDGCQAGSLPLGSPIEIEGAQYPGSLAYSSWLTMGQRGERDANTCAYNDFALIRVDSRDHARVNPTIPHWGGPVALGSTSTTMERVYSYGNSSLRAGLELLKPKTGYSLGQGGGGWTHTVYTATPGIPGDSGSAFLDSQGRALGTLSTLALAPVALSNGVSDLALALDYADRFSALSPRLATGTEPFNGDRLPVGGIGVLGQGTSTVGAPSVSVEVGYRVLGREGTIRF
ncbi:MAG: hypothetical protein WEB03_07630 [Nitriliruptor sp.]|uniref:serine protease n=1 Tax=Nitriliruptor sp. TaxID=2448056 RepID=UPI0034A01019